MPRIAGVNVVAILVATIAFYFVGFLFYGVVFQAQWMALNGFTDASFDGQNAGLSMGLGFLNALVTVIFLAILRKRLAPSSLGSALLIAVLLWAGFALTTLAYDPIYALSPAGLLAIDGAHLFCAYLLGMAVLHLID